MQGVSTNVSAIVEGTKEQATGLREINTAVNSMDQSTQQNAAMVEESTAASHSPAKEAEALFQLIGSFEVGSSHSATGNRRETEIAPPESPARRLMARVAHAVRRNTAAKIDSWKEF